MKAVIVNTHGGPEQLRLDDLPMPDGEVLVRAHWAGINFVDIYQREGRYPGITLPLRPGIEGSGIVERAADGSGWHPGDRVAYTTGVQGSYAEYVAVPARHLIRVPDDIALRDACTAVEHGMTAFVLVRSVARLARNSTVLVHAAAGGVGGWLVQILVKEGHRVFGTVSSEAKAAWLRSAGATPILYGEHGAWARQLHELTGGAGVGTVFDSVGADTFAASLESLAIGGHLVLFGAASGQPGPVEVQRLMARSATLTRPVLPHYLATPSALREHADAVFDAIRTGTVTLRIHGAYRLDEAAQGHAALAGRGTQGKLLLAIRPDDDERR